MNPLQEHPHLFANEQFIFQDNEGYIWELVGSVGGTLVGHIADLEDTETFDPEYATLIARSIEDMTDEELYGTVSHKHHKTASLQQLKMDLQGGQYMEDTLHLLSIGVYPFEQSHFDNGTVININEI